MLSSKSTLLTVSELTLQLKQQLETQFPSIWVQGEITNFKLHSSGHLYFDLKDAEAKIPAVFFRPSPKSLSRLPKEGDQIKVLASLTVYPPHGRYQLVVRELEFSGVGELLLKLEALKKKLTEKGLFDPAKKKPLPAFPKRIGVVTSPTGAVIRDIIHILSRRFSGFHLILNPVRVQGEGAAKEIAQAIEQFNQHQLADVLIVGRGGGSLEDLWAFNEEIIVEAIAKSSIPIISAVGHETDVTLADFAADVRAPTPSAAAELAVSEKVQHLAFLEKSRRSLLQMLSQLMHRYKEKLEGCKRHPFLHSPYTLLALPYQKLDDSREQLDSSMARIIREKKLLIESRHRYLLALAPSTQIQTMKKKLIDVEKRLKDLSSQQLAWKKERLIQLVHRLHSLDPKNVLKRGYSILFAQKEGSVIVTARELTPGQKIRALLADGEAQLTVEVSK